MSYCPCMTVHNAEFWKMKDRTNEKGADCFSQVACSSARIPWKLSDILCWDVCCYKQGQNHERACGHVIDVFLRGR